MKPHQGSSLIRLVIAVLILGAVGAIALPRLSVVGSQRKSTQLEKELAILRNAIGLYASEHGGVFPGNAADGRGNARASEKAFIHQLTLFSNGQGQTSDAGGESFPHGPYLLRIPPVPLGPNAGSSAVAIDTANSPPTTADGPAGWIYNPYTGEIVPSAGAASSNRR